MPRPVIGVVTSHFVRDEKPTNGLVDAYLMALESAASIPLMIYQTENLEVLDWYYRQCHGFLFAGGGDVAASYFGEEQHPNAGQPEVLRDAIEIELIRRAALDGKPIFGICRGAQVLNIALGGDIWQDIPSQHPTAVDHYLSRTLPYEEKHHGHRIHLTAGSWLATQLGTTEMPVNTYHHQSVRRLAPGFRAVAHAPDGIIEAIESTDGTLMVGVQCHPELMQDVEHGRWQHVLCAFAAACILTG